MAHFVTCVYCGKRFDRDKIPFHAVSARRYAHIECFKIEEAKQAKIEKDKKDIAYIKNTVDFTTLEKKCKVYIEMTR